MLRFDEALSLFSQNVLAHTNVASSLESVLKRPKGPTVVVLSADQGERDDSSNENYDSPDGNNSVRGNGPSGYWLDYLLRVRNVYSFVI